MAQEKETMIPVAIIGGGPVGLASSILLSLNNIDHVVFERYPSTSIHPKACGLNQRTIEFFRQLGVEKEVISASAPPERSKRTAWYTSLGPGGKEIYSRDAWGGGQYKEEYERSSPSPYVVCPQIRLEPILQRRAQELNPKALRYLTEVVGVEEKEDRVVLKVKGKREDDGTDLEEEVEASYVLAADGGKGVTDKLGIKWEGKSNIVDMVTAHIRSPISTRHPDPRNFITWFINPEMGGSIGAGYLYHVGPYPAPPEEEEWVFACATRPDEPKKFDEQLMLERFRKSVNFPDLPVEILSLSHWYVNALTAERYHSAGGKVFLVGDAAHRIPPWGALGLNTGLQDVQNLIWKLSLVMKKGVSDELLDTYDEERRKIGQWVCSSSLDNLMKHGGAMDAALGIDSEASVKDNEQAIDQYFDQGHPQSEKKRSAVERAQGFMDSEFKAPGNEIGWYYPSADIENEGAETRHDGQVTKEGEFNVEKYQTSTIPGHSLPHAWLKKKDGVDMSTRDLVQLDKLVLITETPGQWNVVEDDLVHVEVINSEDGPTDAEGAWAKISGVDKDGAVLVRPDGVVAWRAKKFDNKVLKRFPFVLARVLYFTDA